MTNQSSGVKSSTHLLYGFNDTMRKMISKLPPEPKPEAKVIKPKANVLLTDELVLECRTRYEHEGWSKPKLLEAYAQYGVTESYLYSLLTYATRSKLIPKKK